MCLFNLLCIQRKDSSLAAQKPPFPLIDFLPCNQWVSCWRQYVFRKIFWRVFGASWPCKVIRSGLPATTHTVAACQAPTDNAPSADDGCDDVPTARGVLEHSRPGHFAWSHRDGVSDGGCRTVSVQVSRAARLQRHQTLKACPSVDTTDFLSIAGTQSDSSHHVHGDPCGRTNPRNSTETADHPRLSISHT